MPSDAAGTPAPAAATAGKGNAPSGHGATAPAAAFADTIAASPLLIAMASPIPASNDKPAGPTTTGAPPSQAVGATATASTPTPTAQDATTDSAQPVPSVSGGISVSVMPGTAAAPPAPSPIAAHTPGGVAHQSTQANPDSGATATAANVTAAAPPAAPSAQTTVALPTATTAAGGPVEQVATALLSAATGAVSRIDPGPAAAVTQLQLRPESLGTVTVTIARAADGSARVDIAATRPETLMLLSRDQAILNNALSATGLASPGAAIHLHLGLADVAAVAGSHAGIGGNGSGGGQGQSETANQLATIAADAGGFGGSHSGGFATNGGGNGGAGQTGYPHAMAATSDTPADAAPARPVGAARSMGSAAAAIDITA